MRPTTNRDLSTMYSDTINDIRNQYSKLKKNPRMSRFYTLVITTLAKHKTRFRMEHLRNLDEPCSKEDLDLFFGILDDMIELDEGRI